MNKRKESDYELCTEPTLAGYTPVEKETIKLELKKLESGLNENIITTDDFINNFTMFLKNKMGSKINHFFYVYSENGDYWNSFKLLYVEDHNHPFKMRVSVELLIKKNLINKVYVCPNDLILDNFTYDEFLKIHKIVKKLISHLETLDFKRKKDLLAFKIVEQIRESLCLNLVDANFERFIYSPREYIVIQFKRKNKTILQPLMQLRNFYT